MPFGQGLRGGRSFRKNMRRYKRKGRKLATVGAVKRIINNMTDKAPLATIVTGGAIIQAGTIYNVQSSTTANSDARWVNYEIRFKVTNITNANNTVRFILFQYKDDATPTTDDVLNTAVLPEVYVNVAHFGRVVHILNDVTYSMNLFDKSQHVFYFKHGAKSMRRAYFDNDGVLNKVYLLAISSDADTNTTLGSMYIHEDYYAN